MSVANFGARETASVNSPAIVQAVGRGLLVLRASRRDRSMAPNVARSTSGTLIPGAIDLGATMTMPVHAAVATASGQRRGRLVERGGGGSTSSSCATGLLVHSGC